MCEWRRECGAGMGGRRGEGVESMVGREERLGLAWRPLAVKSMLLRARHAMTQVGG